MITVPLSDLEKKLYFLLADTTALDPQFSCEFDLQEMATRLEISTDDLIEASRIKTQIYINLIRDNGFNQPKDQRLRA